MSLTFKLLSLVVRTVAKPIANGIKRRAREHEGFRRFAIASAQQVHRIDMRLRLGLLHDAEAQQRMHEREQRAAEEKKKKAETPTVRTEEEQKKYDEEQAKEEKKEKAKPARIKIRPLSDARAIELGANFFSESFIFFIAVGLLLAENLRSNRKAGQRRDEVAERLDAIEARLDRLQQEHHLPELEALNEKIKQAREAKNKPSWWNPAGWWRRTDPEDADDVDEGIPGEVDTSDSRPAKPIPGNVPGPPPDEAVRPVSDLSKSQQLKVETGSPKAPSDAVPRVETVTATKKQR